MQFNHPHKISISGHLLLVLEDSEKRAARQVPGVLSGQGKQGTAPKNLPRP